MSHLPENKEEMEIVEEEDGKEPPEVRNNIVPVSPGTRAISISARGRDKGMKTEGTISASLGAMVPLAGKLDMLLAPEGQSSKRVKDAIRLLKEDVEELSSYLDELAEVEDPPPTAMCWMNEARDLSYDMEDYIHNIYEHPEDPSLIAKTARGHRSLVAKTTRGLLKLNSHDKTPKRLMRSISEYRKYVQEAIQRREVYGLSDSGPSSVSTLRRRFVSGGPMLPTPYEETTEIVIDSRMNDFITSLAKDGDQQLKVVSVFGSTCLGKTTLARVCYNTIFNQYNCRAFIRVSRKPDMKRIFHDMLSQLQGQHPPKDCKELGLIDNIKKYLQDKRYLIIIDDLCTASAWNIINQAFPKGSHGSRIIITTQIEDVAFTCCSYQSEHVFEMKPLDEDHSRKLFFNRIFGSESYCPQQLKEILTEIVEICCGLPLATISIAGLIASQPVITADHLTHIYQSLSSCFSANSTSERTRQVLNLSYNNLPQHLKTCLLYVSMYPEGSTFYKDDIVKQWMAELFINTTEGQDIKEVATSYLAELIGRRFIHPTCIKHNNEVVSFALHDAVHDLIAHKSAEENFIVAIDYSQISVEISRKVRRLSLLFGDARYAKTPVNIRKTQVRSLTFFGLHECMPCIKEFKLLCVLNLHLSDHCGDDNPVDLTGISELFQLRYLKIMSDVCIKLPKHGLGCLETLDITDARVAVDGVVPCVPYIHLPHLLHLSLSDQIDLVKWIYSLVTGGKVNYLQHLHITTPSTSASYDLETIMEILAFMIRTGHHKLNTIVVRAGSSIEHAVVRGDDVSSNIQMVEKLPPLLQRFEFVKHNRFCFSRIPLSIEKHSNLRILKIEVRGLEMSCVDILRGLPALTALSLYVQIAPNQRIIFDKTGFSVLKYFKLRFKSGIAWLKFKADAMPNLCKLKLVFDAIPRMDKELVLFSNCPPFEHHEDSTAVITVEHMPGLKDISVKFGGAVADVQYALRVGVSNHPSNPTINKRRVDYSMYGDDRSKLKQQQDEILMEEPNEYDQKPADVYYKQQPDEILEEEPDEYYKEQPDDILGEQPSISSSLKISPRLHVPDHRFAIGSVKNIVELAIGINKAVGIVRFNKDACVKLRKIVDKMHAVVALLESMDMAGTPGMATALTNLENSLHRGHDLVIDCQKKRGTVYTIFRAGWMSEQLLKVKDDIRDQLSVLLITLITRGPHKIAKYNTTPLQLDHAGDAVPPTEVKEALQLVGLESVNLIIGVDFTKSNEWAGKHCFSGRSLHHLGNTSLNPYERAIGIIGDRLSAFDEDNVIPCFGFGDMSTGDLDVFSFYGNRRDCVGVPEVLQRYREIAGTVRLSGPTSLAPIIEAAMGIVQDSGYQYHILLIIADGQVPRCSGAHCASNLEETRSENYIEERTLQALIHASHFPLSIVLVGVGDGPWDNDLMRINDNRCLFDNFQFVDFTKIMSTEMSQADKEEQFALEALKKIPAQYAAIISQRISDLAARAPVRTPLAPPF